MSWDSQKKILRDSHTKRGLDEAVSYVTKGWLPVNPTLLQEVQKKLGEGYYTGRPQLLFDDLKRDLALFAFCLRSLQTVVDRENLYQSPASILMSLEASKIRELLNVPEEQISMHRFGPSMKPQAICLRGAIISSTTAEALAERSDIDPKLAFTCAAIRQLGLNLVAWNYPRIYTKALSSTASSDDGLDIALGKMLGYSPMQLGVRATLDWTRCPDVRVAVGLDEVRESEAEEKEPAGLAKSTMATPLGEKLREFCEVGEALARINDSEHYPAAAQEWEKVVSELKHYLGPQAVSVISEKVDRNGASYRQVSEALRFQISPEQSLHVAQSQQAKKLLDGNSYVRRCPEKVQDLFRQVYETIVPGSVSSTAVNVLVSEVIPALGFTRGCIYLVDPRNMMLVPMLRVGEAPLARYRPLSVEDSGDTSNPVVTALSYSAPIIQENIVLHGDQVSHVTGVFGDRDKTGVLYLEMSETLIESDRQTPITYFKAVRKCLNDCLNLRSVG